MKYDSIASRRQLLLGAGALAGAGLLPGMIKSVLAATVDYKLNFPPPAIAQFSVSGDAVTSPWGEMRLSRNGSLAYPVLIRSADKLGEISLAQKQPSIVIGGIALTSAGVSFAKGAKPEAWSTATVDKLVKSLAADRQKARALMQLRSTFVSAYPAFLASTKSSMDKRLGSAFDKASKAMDDAGCTTSNVTSTVQREVTEFAEQWKSAEEQYDACFEHETSGDSGLACSLAPAGIARDTCATSVCVAKGFVDVLVAVIEVTRTVTEEVVRTVVTCTTALKGAYKNVWNIVDRVLPGLEKPGTSPPKFSEKDFQAAFNLLKDLTAPFGPFAKCLLSGKWSVEGIPTPITMGDGNLAIPYGFRVCIGAECAHKLTIQGVGQELAQAWPAAITLLAALSPEFLTFMTSLGVPVVIPAVVAAAVAVVPPAVMTVAALMLALIILALIYGTAIAAQLSVAEQLGAFNDGEVCIVHPTLALALIKALFLGNAPTELVPPIVVG